jgi:glycerol uptake facilitator protein
MFTKSQEFLAEVIGTMVLILFGCGVCAMVNLFGSGIPGEVVMGGFTNITLGWGLAVTFGVYASGKISGAHLNPAVTLGLAVTGRFPKNKIWYYLLAQIIGAFVGAAIVFAVYYTKWVQVDPEFTKAGVFATFPAVANTSYFAMSGLVDQIVGTALLVGMILAVTDGNNNPPGANMSPIVIGLIVVAIGISFGGMHGYAINPARDFGPRLFAAAAGFKANGLTDGTGVWLVPIIGPLIGGVIGAVLYEFTGAKIMKFVQGVKYEKIHPGD